MKKLFITIALVAFASNTFGATYTVCASGCDYTTFTAAFAGVDAAGDDIFEGRAATAGGSATFAETVAPGADDIGSSGHNVVVRGRAGDTITIDGESARANCITASRNYVTYQNFTVTGATASAISIAADGNTVTGCTVSDSGTFGINNQAGSDSTTISSNTITAGSVGVNVANSGATGCNTISITGNDILNCGTHGIWVNMVAGSTGAIYTVDITSNTIRSNTNRGIRVEHADGAEISYDFNISSNTIHSNGDCGASIRDLINTSGQNLFASNTIYSNGATNTLGGLWVGNTVSPVVEHNTVYSNTTNGIDGRGIYIDTGSTDAIVRYNYCYSHITNSTPPNQSSGIAVSAAAGVDIYYNLLVGNDSGITIGSAATDVIISNNTISASVDRGISIQASTDATELTIRNNIFSGNLVHGLYDSDAVGDATESNNCWYGNGTDTYQHTKGSGVSADPAFNTGLYTLSPASPCINAGLFITGIHDQATAATDYPGTSVLTIPDIGAYEYTIPTIYFDGGAAAGGNGTLQYPYDETTDYSFSNEYSARTGITIDLRGDLTDQNISLGSVNSSQTVIYSFPDDDLILGNLVLNPGAFQFVGITKKRFIILKR